MIPDTSSYQPPPYDNQSDRLTSKLNEMQSIKNLQISETSAARKGCCCSRTSRMHVQHHQTRHSSSSNKALYPSLPVSTHSRANKKIYRSTILNHPKAMLLSPKSLISLVLGVQLILIVLTLAAMADPLPAISASSANNSGGTRSATTKSLRGPPLNGSIFGKRSTASSKPSGHQKHSQQELTTNYNEIEDYKDVITDIIENFLAKNAEGK